MTDDELAAKMEQAAKFMDDMRKGDDRYRGLMEDYFRDLVGELVAEVKRLRAENAELHTALDESHEETAFFVRGGMPKPSEMTPEQREAIFTDHVPAMLEAARKAGEAAGRAANERVMQAILGDLPPHSVVTLKPGMTYKPAPSPPDASPS